jgi:hypothetical protein
VKKNIVWIVSYPKSGNTWLRIFIRNILSGTNSPIDINELRELYHSSSRVLFDSYSDMSSSDLDKEEIDLIRPKIYNRISEESDKLIFLKVHEVWRRNANNEDIFPRNITKGVIYILRNPLDIAVSLKFHNNVSIKEAIKFLNSKESELCKKNGKLYTQFYQKISSWSSHVTSWIDLSGLKIHIVRYEDMLERSFYTFKNVLQFLDYGFNDKEISSAIKNSKFKELRSQEKNYGFKEKPINSSEFFRSGKKNDYKKYLNESDIHHVIKEQRFIMERFGYL